MKILPILLLYTYSIAGMSSTSSLGRMPKLVVFDLDYTLWPFWVDTHFQPPFSKNSSENVVDSRQNRVDCYAESTAVLEYLYKLGIDMAVASRTSEIQGARQLIQLFGWERYFKYKDIYPGSKLAHFESFRKKSKVPFHEMLFFDDEMRNVREVSSIGAVAILVKSGMTMRLLKEGLQEFAQTQS